MMNTTIKIALGLALAFVGFQAQALLLTPGGEYTNEIFYPAYNNPDEADISAIVGSSVDLLYKDNVGGVEEGMANFMASYKTEYFNTPADPADALLSYQGGDVMTDASWLLVKDGSQLPSWYLFDISSWNGLEVIEMVNFWPAQGSISHISVLGNATTVSEPGIIALLAIGLLGFGLTRRRTH
jgi:hypothetical protein